MHPRLALGLLGGTALLAAMPVASEIHGLARGELRVDIEVNDNELIEQFGPRFDRSAWVRRISSAGLELLGPWGLPDEFGLYGNGAIGYEEAAVGESFIKIGVGRLLRDTEAAYHFAHPYPVESLFPAASMADAGSLTVVQYSDGDGPWQYRYVKSYQLTGPDELSISYQLTNTGTLTWTFEHYNHHWFQISHSPVGPDYSVHSGFELPAAQTRFAWSPDALHMARPLAEEEAAYQSPEP